MRTTPLESWIAERIIGIPGTHLAQGELQRYQLEQLGRTVEYVTRRSPFYSRRLAGFSHGDLRNLEDLAQLPFTTPEDIREHGAEFLCVSQSQIDRVVTLAVPGVTEEPRRIYFTGEDLERTIDFFHHGMPILVEPGQKVLILMPGDRPGSVGDLLAQALKRMDVEGVVHGIVDDPSKAIHEIVAREIDCLVGIPIHVLSIARHPRAKEIGPGRIKSVLLSADYVPEAIVSELQRVWNCPVFNHYGTSEMGFGGGVECQALSGYHLREADLYFEIVDPVSGRPQPPGEPGEVVFTTLTRKGMPLIRYRTGDLARFLTEMCPCGSVLRRMEKICGRLHEMVRLRTGVWLGITDLDEAVLSLSGILNYSATVTSEADVDHLDIVVDAGARGHEVNAETVARAVLAVPAIELAVANGTLTVGPVRFGTVPWATKGVAKRAILKTR